MTEQSRNEFLANQTLARWKKATGGKTLYSSSIRLPSGEITHHHGLVAQMERNQRRRDTAKGKGPASRVARMAIAQREGRRPRPL
jgi:hypothetical protein